MKYMRFKRIVLDVYDGIHHEDLYSSRIRKIRMDLLKECMRFPAGPCFVALIGEEYGKPCLPTQIDSEEFEKILHTAEKNRVCTRVLETWYVRDENGVPPIYSLLDKEEVFQHSYTKNGAGTEEPNRDWLYQASREMKMVFHTVVPLCVQNGILEADQAKKYLNSALEEELIFALQNRSPDLLEKCICYVHKVPYKTLVKQRMRSEQLETGGTHSYAKLCYIRDTFIPELARHGSLNVYNTTTTCDIKVGYTEEKEQMYIEGLCRQFYCDMLTLIERKLPINRAHRNNRTEEVIQHLSLCTMYAELQQYEFKEAECIYEYIVHDTSQKPMVVLGEPHCGKTVLLAACAKKVHTWLKGTTDPVLVMRFVSLNWDPISLSSLLKELCQQLADAYQKEIPGYLEDISALRQCFVNLLSASSKQSPLILILDAVDHVTFDVDVRTLWWLQFPLPQFTKIIISVTQDKNVSSDLVKSLHHDQVLFLAVTPLRKECNKNLRQSLLEKNRKITSGQQVYVNRSLELNTSPLQVLLLLREVMRWKSHQDIGSESLGENTHETIERLFHKLEIKYDYEILSRALSYITLSRSGIGEAELVDLLSIDDMVLDHLYPSHENVDILKVPDWLVASILLDLKECLSQIIITGHRVVSWTNSLYKSVVCKRYLSCQEIVQELHKNMCHYFSGRWASGRPRSKPVKEMQNPLQGEIPPNVRNKCHNAPTKPYADCQFPSQPWFFTVQSIHQNADTGNIRKAYELPFHLKKCGKLDDLYNDVLMVLPYYKVLLRYGKLNLLINTIEDAAQLTGRKDVYFICETLKEVRCLINENSLDIILQSKMMPLVYPYPCLLRFVKNLYFEGIKNSSIIVWHSPLIKVPVNKIQYQNSSSVINVFEMKAESLLIIVFENGSVYTWDMKNNLNLRYQLFAEIKGIAIEKECRYLAICTVNHLFILLDCISWTELHEIIGYGCEDANKNKFIPKSFHFSNTSLFVCFENSATVRIYSVLSGEVTNEFIFPQEVTFFACDSSDKYTVLGQPNKILICDNKNFSNQISLSIDHSRHLIGDVYIYKSVVYIIDKAGNINVWDIAHPAKPQLFDEIEANEEYNEVIYTDFSPEWLLMCRSKHIDVWETKNWVKNSFKAPQGNTFICCVFSHSFEEIIAAVENARSLFVWNRESGQCISTISLEHGVLTQLSKCHGLSKLVAVTTDQFLMLWDLKSVASPKSYFQTGRSVVSVVLCPKGTKAYTADGSDMVCRWNITCCQIIDLFHHDDNVEVITLTATGELLVTSLTSGYIYVWVTETGENIHLIQSSPVSQFLITPKTHFVVSLCENGISRVWKPTTGNTVCTIHPFLSQAVVTPESTFLVGIDNRRLLAVSLWSGCICKEFHNADKSDSILAFQCLKTHPNFIVLITNNADLYTWNVVEETICHLCKLPASLSQPCNLFFNLSFDGSIMVTTQDRTVNVINSSNGKLAVFYAPHAILHQHLTKDGKYFIYVCNNNDKDCRCDFHLNPVLHVMKTFNGESIGQCYLGKMPSTLSMSEDESTICIGFEDGTLGLYSIVEMCESHTRMKKCISAMKNTEKRAYSTVKIHKGKQSPNIIWTDSMDCSLNGENETVEK
ncbi:NACHT and WD repeat domain-containing protein 2-like [Rhinophrynus dorsalis]